MRVIEIYHGSDGEATKALYDRLKALGPVGVVALNLFRAQKCSDRAKGYRRRAHKSEAYDRKNWSMNNLCQALMDHAEALNLNWGWKIDPEADFHKWVLYVDLPTGQCSFHSTTRMLGMDYTREWDATHNSAGRIVTWCSQLLGEPVAPNVFDAIFKHAESNVPPPCESKKPLTPEKLAQSIHELSQPKLL